MENKETKETITEEVSINDTSAPDTAEEKNCDTKIDALTAQVQDLNDKYLRMAAELENTRRRAALDAESAARRRAMNIAQQFLPVMDAAEAALKHAPDDEGIKSMARSIEAAFAQIGIVKIESVGQPLNPQFHNAIQVIEADAKPNTIIDEMQAGYMFGDTVMRTAMVIVAK